MGGGWVGGWVDGWVDGGVTVTWWQAVAVLGAVAAAGALAAAAALSALRGRRGAPAGESPTGDASAASSPPGVVPAASSPAPPTASAAPAAAAPAAVGSPPSGDAVAAMLTDGLIGAFDLAGSSPAVLAHVRQVLRRAGIVPLDATPGTPFDPAVHLAVDTEISTDLDSHRPDTRPGGGTAVVGTVARQVRAGWRDGAGVLRPAEVVVWTTP